MLPSNLAPRGLLVLLLTLLGCLGGTTTSEAQTTLYLDQSMGDDANDGESWVTAYRSLAATTQRINDDPDVAGVNLSAGWYRGNVVLDRTVNFISGFAPGGGEFSPWRWRAVIVGDGDGPVFRFLPGSGGALLGLVIRGGRSLDEPIAGGVTATNAAVSLLWCVIENNVGCRGGGVHFDSRGMATSPRMTNSVIRNNVATCEAGPGLGGGVYILVDEATESQPALLANCRIENNRAAPPQGGGLAAGGALIEGNVSIEGCSFVGNEGTGLLLSSGTSSVFHPVGAVKASVFADNSGYGAAVACPGDYAFSQSTFSDNAAGALGSYEYLAPDPSASVSLHGSIVWQQAGELFANACQSASLAVTDSLIEGGYPLGVGIVDVDPSFETGPWGHFYLSQTVAGDALDSPATDAGPEDAMDVGMHLRTTRVDSLRDEGIVDLGAHYFMSDFVGGPDIDIDRYEDLTLPVSLTTVPRFPFLDEPGLLSDATRPLLYYRVSHLQIPLLLSKDVATDSLLLHY